MLKICATGYTLKGLFQRNFAVIPLFKHRHTLRTIMYLTTLVNKNNSSERILIPALRGGISRNFSKDSEDKSQKTPLLMAFEPVLRPEVWLSIKNWVLIKLIIRPYLDNDFVLKDFITGAKQAIVTVSNYLSSGDFQSLAGLVSDEALSEVKRNYSLMNLKQRQDLSVKLSDILFTFPYQIGIMFDDNSQQRFCEITVVYHILKGFDEGKDMNFELLEKRFSGEGKEDITICNYRFIREYTKGIQSSWIINRIGHFRFSHLQQ